MNTYLVVSNPKRQAAPITVDRMHVFIIETGAAYSIDIHDTGTSILRAHPEDITALLLTYSNVHVVQISDQHYHNLNVSGISMLTKEEHAQHKAALAAAYR